MTAQQRIQLGLSILWGALIFPSVLLWRNSVPWLVFISVYANFVGHISALVAANAEARIRAEGSGSRERVPAERDREAGEAERDQLDRHRPAGDEEGGDQPEDDRGEEEDALEGRIHLRESEHAPRDTRGALS